MYLLSAHHNAIFVDVCLLSYGQYALPYLIRNVSVSTGMLQYPIFRWHRLDDSVVNLIFHDFDLGVVNAGVTAGFDIVDSLFQTDLVPGEYSIDS